MLKQIKIQELRPGMVITRITLQNGPVKIKKAGLVTSQDMVQGLIEMGIQQVEVDPEQTVEVEASQGKKSTTQRMFESNNVANTRKDDGLSEQYHRSLFLPSVQDIPSAWQFYGKRYLLALFIGLGGVGLGWSLASYQQILDLVNAKLVASVVSAPVASVAPEKQQVTAAPKLQIEAPKDNTVSMAVDEPEQQLADPANAKKDPEPSPELTENRQVATAPAEPEAQISAEVLARFEKAMTEVQDLPVTAPVVATEAISKDVPRIDQLPAWVLTRLPSMAFSAHMYASVASDRWVRVNGTRMGEGDKIDGLIEIVRIEPQHVILNYSGQTFSMAALTDW